MLAAETDRKPLRQRVRTVRAKGSRFAALLDLENVAITGTGRLRQAEMTILLGAIADRVFDMPVRVATGINVLRPYMDLVDLQRWGLTLVKTEPEAADNALCDAARDFISCGVTDIVIVSGDHAFVPLATHARLHVISHADHLSNALRLAATTVTLLPEIRPAVRAAS
jgi:hypothetical protein